MMCHHTHCVVNNIELRVDSVVSVTVAEDEWREAAQPLLSCCSTATNTINIQSIDKLIPKSHQHDRLLLRTRLPPQEQITAVSRENEKYIKQPGRLIPPSLPP